MKDKKLLPSIRNSFNDIVDSWFEDVFEPVIPKSILRDNYPKIDIKESEKEYTVFAEIPGVDKKDIKVDVRDNLVTLSFEKKQEKDEKNENWRVVERSYGKFTRSFTLPEPVKADEAKASYKDGVLKIVLPKEKETKSHQIKID